MILNSLATKRIAVALSIKNPSLHISSVPFLSSVAVVTALAITCCPSLETFSRLAVNTPSGAPCLVGTVLLVYSLIFVPVLQMSTPVVVVQIYSTS